MFSHSILAGPLSGGSLVLGSVSLVDVSDLRHKGVVRVGISQQRADGEQHLRDGESWGPLILQDVQANAAVRVDVGMVDPGGEVALGRLEGVVGREVDVQEEHTSSIGRIIRSHDGGLPVVLILLVDRAS